MCYACDVSIDPQSESIAPIVNGVMTALSSAQQSEVKAWEQEMIACEHALTLQQSTARQLESQNLATCSQCELNANLWLCLVCGTLSCGRAQFGGGGGNGHGLQHVDSTGHALAVKLGSITPDGTADVYCYSCDEERVDPLLQEHLAHWGVKLADRTKTEKSLQEMQIEQNMKWEFSMTSEEGKERIPLFGPGFTGMKNIGNSCYLASILQCLFSLHAFASRFLLPFQKDMQRVVDDPANDLEVQLRKIADGLLSGNFSKPQGSSTEDTQFQLGIAPSMFKALIGKGHAEFSTMRQQDAFEFLLYLVEKIDALQSPETFQKPTNVFRFLAEQRTQCKGCKKVAYKTTEQDNISVLVPARKIKSTNEDDAVKYESVSVIELLDIWTGEEHVEYTCAACSSKVGATKRTLFKTFPELLVLNPGRFSIDNWVPVKLEIPVEIPAQGPHLEKYRSTGLQDHEEVLPDDIPASSGQEPKANEADVEQLMAMGFPKVRAEKALLVTGATIDVAMEWLFAHMEDADIDEPYRAPASQPTSRKEPDLSVVRTLMDMGFPQIRCEKASLANPGSGLEALMEWLMQHMEDPDIDDPITTTSAADVQMTDADVGSRDIGNTDGFAQYQVKAMVCHKGSSIHAGHYVAFIKKQVEGKEDWVLFNDEKVVRGVDWQEASKTAYVYFFEQIRS